MFFFARLRKCPRGREASFCAAASQVAWNINTTTNNNKNGHKYKYIFWDVSPFVLLHHRSRPAVQSFICLLDNVNQTSLCFCFCFVLLVLFVILYFICFQLFRKFIGFGGATRPSVFEYPNIWMFFFIFHWIQCKGIGILKICSTIIEKKSPKWRDIILMIVHH